jgi:hypothetical protein
MDGTEAPVFSFPLSDEPSQAIVEIYAQDVQNVWSIVDLTKRACCVQPARVCACVPDSPCLVLLQSIRWM